MVRAGAVQTDDERICVRGVVVRRQVEAVRLLGVVDVGEEGQYLRSGFEPLSCHLDRQYRAHRHHGARQEASNKCHEGDLSELMVAPRTVHSHCRHACQQPTATCQHLKVTQSKKRGRRIAAQKHSARRGAGWG